MDSNQLYELNVFVSGRVQGVGFRFFTQEIAQQLGVVGWARNTSDGQVEIKSFGDKETLDQFLNYVKKGPSAARVNDIQTKWKPISQTECSDFSIKL